MAALGVVALGVAYAVGVARLRRRSARGVPNGAVALFAAGWLVLAVALVSPLHALGAALYSAHMAQHELLMVLAAPLLVAARPHAALAWALPGAARWSARVTRRAGALGEPLAATAVHAVAVWAWHAPALYALSLRSEVAHAAQHASFFGTALLFWWSVLAPRGRARLGARVLALFLTALHTGALGALLAVAPRPLVSAYLTTTAPWGLTPLDDQALAGLLMWIPGGAAYVAAALALLARVLRDDLLPTPAARRA